MQNELNQFVPGLVESDVLIKTQAKKIHSSSLTDLNDGPMEIYSWNYCNPLLYHWAKGALGIINRYIQIYLDSVACFDESTLL